MTTCLNCGKESTKGDICGECINVLRQIASMGGAIFGTIDPDEEVKRAKQAAANVRRITKMFDE